MADDGQHLGIAKVPGNLPASGAANDTLAAATKPTLASGAVASGTVTSGALTAKFGGNTGTTIAYTLVLTMPDGTFVVDANGGAAQPGDAGGGTFGGDAGFRFTGHDLAVSTDAGTCAPAAGPCPTSGASRVVFAGTNAERVIVAYVISAGSLASARRGVAVFQRQ